MKFKARSEINARQVIFFRMLHTRTDTKTGQMKITAKPKIFRKHAISTRMGLVDKRTWPTKRSTNEPRDMLDRPDEVPSRQKGNLIKPYMKTNAFIIMMITACMSANCMQSKPHPSSFRETLEYLRTHSDYVNLKTISGVRIDLRYAGKNNFMGENLYGDFRECFLHRTAAAKLSMAVRYLRDEKPGHEFLVFDGLRPRSVQRKMWNRVKDTPSRDYVADPERGSVHNFGLAVDLTVVNEKGRALAMGTDFDSFQPLAEAGRELELLRGGKLRKDQLENRLLLRRAMIRAGFIQLPNEWWHFDALPAPLVRRDYRIVE